MTTHSTRSTTTRLRSCFAEALGTCILVLLGPGAVIVSTSTQAFGHTGIALAFGLVVTLLVASIGPISGAHLNPAVTIAFWSVNRFPTDRILPYIAAQCAGAIAGALALSWLFGAVGNSGATVPALDTTRSFAIEAGFSFILAFTIFAVASDERNAAVVAPLIIGTTVFVGALVTGPLTGGSFNPARSLGPAVAGNIWQAHWLYWAAPVLGMVVAAQVYVRLFSCGASNSKLGVSSGVEGEVRTK